MTGFISFVCNGVQPLHKGVTGIGASSQRAALAELESIAISSGNPSLCLGSDVYGSLTLPL